MNYLDLAKSIVEQASTNGIEAEAFIMDSEETEIRLQAGKMEKLSHSASKGVGVRIIDHGRVGYAYTSDFSDDSIEKTWKTAIELAAVATEDKLRTLPDPQPISDENLEIYDSNLSTITTEQKIDLLKQIEQASLDYDDRIFAVMMCVYFDSISHVHLANSKGFAGSYDRTTSGAYLVSVARDDSDAAEAFGLGVSNFFDDLDAKKIGEEGSKRAIDILGGKPVPTQECSVVFDAMVVGELLGYIATAMNANSIQKGRSFLVDKLGQEIASDKVVLIDHGRMKRGLSSAPFDGEGNPTSITRLIDEGMFQNIIYDSYTAKKDDTISTGNAGRQSHRDVPSLGISNFYLQPGPKSLDDIISEIDNGMYVTRIMQTGGVDPVTGDCSMAAYGLWIENGKLTKAVSGVTVATTLVDLLKNVSEVGSDLRIVPFMGSVNTPSIRVDNITVGGS